MEMHTKLSALMRSFRGHSASDNQKQISSHFFTEPLSTRELTQMLSATHASPFTLLITGVQGKLCISAHLKSNTRPPQTDAPKKQKSWFSWLMRGKGDDDMSIVQGISSEIRKLSAWTHAAAALKNISIMRGVCGEKLFESAAVHVIDPKRTEPPTDSSSKSQRVCVACRLLGGIPFELKNLKLAVGDQCFEDGLLRATNHAYGLNSDSIPRSEFGEVAASCGIQGLVFEFAAGVQHLTPPTAAPIAH